VLFQNRGDGTFDEVGNVLGVALKLDSRGAAVADLDLDGDLDLVVVNRNNPIIRVYRNDAPGQGRAVMVDLVAADGNTAIGAQAIAACGERKMLRQVEAGSGFLSQSAATLHFGLAGCEGLDSLEVHWPAGTVETWRDLPAEQLLRLEEGAAGDGMAAVADARPFAERNYTATSGSPAIAGSISAPVPEVAFRGLGDGEGLDLMPVGLGTGSGVGVGEGDDNDNGGALDGGADDGPILLNFWATWCVPCRAEMPDLAELDERFSPLGVRFYGVVMDEADQAEAVRDFLDEVGVEYPQVWGDVESHAPFAALGNSPAGSIPTTVVILDGIVRHVVAGTIDPLEIESLLEALVAEHEGEA